MSADGEGAVAVLEIVARPATTALALLRAFLDNQTCPFGHRKHAVDPLFEQYDAGQ